MIRKLVQQGQTTLMLSLPSSWIKSNHLSKGDPVHIDEESNKLILSNEGVISQQNKEIDLNFIKYNDFLVKKSLVSVYRNGFNKVKIRFKGKGQLMLIESILNNELIGFEVISEGDGSCVVENIISPLSQKIDSIYFKIFKNIEYLFDLISDGEGDGDVLKTNISKFNNLCLRILNNNGHIDDSYKISFHINLMGFKKNLFDLYDSLSSKNKKINISLFNKLKEGYLCLVDVFRTDDVDKLNFIYSINYVAKDSDLSSVYLSNCFNNLEMMSEALINEKYR